MNAPPERPIALKVFSLPGHLPVVRSAVEKVCEMVGFDTEVAGNIVLSVNEALTNIIRHAYQGAEDQPIEIDITPLGGDHPTGLRIRLRDYGRQVDPSKIKSRDLKDVRPGGLGVHIMNECMDSVEFAPVKGGGTLLTMIKTVESFPSKQEAKK